MATTDGWSKWGDFFSGKSLSILPPRGPLTKMGRYLCTAQHCTETNLYTKSVKRSPRGDVPPLKLSRRRGQVFRLSFQGCALGKKNCAGAKAKFLRRSFEAVRSRRTFRSLSADCTRRDHTGTTLLCTAHWQKRGQCALYCTALHCTALHTG